MFFTRLGRVIAWIVLLMGVARASTGFYVASLDNALVRVKATADYLGSGTSGQAVDKGLMAILVAIALGIQAEIGTAIHRRPN